MGFLDRLFSRPLTEASRPQPKKIDVAVGAGSDKDETIQSFENSNITFSGELVGYDYSAILRNKQDNIVTLYQLADYYADADPIIRGIIEHVYIPYSTCSDWYLTGSKEKTYALYEEQYKRMRLREKITGIFKELWKYSNVCCYLHNGDLITLPVHKWKIGNVLFNGTPIVEYNCQSIINQFRTKGYSVKEDFLKDGDIKTVLEGYPEEIQKAIVSGQEYAQLNPENTFVLQLPKEGWMRYAVPFIASCLPALAKKELISAYETSILNIGKRSFVHVTYGESGKTQDILPDERQLTQVRRLFQQGMSGFPLVVTNHLANAKLIQADLDDLFQWDKFKDVNNDILSAGGVSGIIVSGISEDGSTFASAQVSMQTAETRINAARDEFCEMMTKINERLTEFMPGTYNLKEIPEFRFQPLSMEGKKAMREKCIELWTKGTVSTKTMMKTVGYSVEVEKTLREKEAEDGTDAVFKPREVKASSNTKTTDNQNDGKQGRPTKDDSERQSDPESSETGRQPKPSNPEGSEKQDDSG
jgi:hypothetical protein